MISLGDIVMVGKQECLVMLLTIVHREPHAIVLPLGRGRRKSVPISKLTVIR